MSALRRVDIRVLVGLIFVVTAGYAFIYRIHPVVDARAYDAIAMNMRDGYGYREDRTVPVLNDLSIVRAGPGYEFFLLGLYTVFGHHYEAVWLVQALMHAGSAFLLYCIALRLFGKQEGQSIGIVAAVLYGFWPDLIEISAMLMTETLYLFLTAVSLYVFVRLFDAPTSKLWGILLGVITGLAILTRPPVVLFAAVYLAYFVVKKVWIPALLFCLSVGALLIPWTVHNYGVYHQFIPTTLLAEFNLWLGNTVTATGGQFSGGYNPLDAYLHLNGALGLKSYAHLMFRLFIVEHPFLFMQLCALRFVRFFSLLRPMGFWFYQTGIRQLLFVCASGIWISFVSVCGLIGMRQSWRGLSSSIRYLIVMAATVPIPLLLTVVQSRYRFQMYPFLALFAGYALVVGQHMPFKCWWTQPIVRTTVFFFAAISFVDGLYFFPVVWEHLTRLFS